MLGQYSKHPNHNSTVQDMYAEQADLQGLNLFDPWYLFMSVMDWWIFVNFEPCYGV